MMPSNYTSPSRLLISYTFMVDVICAAHFQTLSSLSTTELFLELPSSRHQFQQVYRQLLNSHEPLPSNIHSREDVLLLLVGLLCDIIYIQRNDLAQRMRSKIKSSGQRSSSRDPTVNPFTPLSHSRERERQQKLLTSALGRWHRHFGVDTDKNILALFFFCKLLLSCSTLPLLSWLSGYAVFPATGLASQDMVLASDAELVSVSEESVKYAWKVLDHVNVSQGSLDTQLPIWLPPILFSSALVVWQNLRSLSSTSGQYGSLKVLGTFIHELNQLPWDCCQVMSSVLQRLSVQHST